MKSKIDLFVITRIKERRMQKNISQRGLAAILDCSPSFIGQVESEKFDVKYSVHQVFSLPNSLNAPLQSFSLLLILILEVGKYMSTFL